MEVHDQYIKYVSIDVFMVTLALTFMTTLAFMFMITLEYVFAFMHVLYFLSGNMKMLI